jgi:hypothetical protein
MAARQPNRGDGGRPCCTGETGKSGKSGKPGKSAAPD